MHVLYCKVIVCSLWPRCLVYIEHVGDPIGRRNFCDSIIHIYHLFLDLVINQGMQQRKFHTSISLLIFSLLFFTSALLFLTSARKGGGELKLLACSLLIYIHIYAQKYGTYDTPSTILYLSLNNISGILWIFKQLNMI